MELTPWLLLVHITGATVFVGGDIVLNVGAFRAWRDGSVGAFLHMERTLTPAIGVGAATTILAGISLVLVNDTWSFVTFFVLAALIIVVISATTETIWFQSRMKELTRLVESEPTSPQIKPLLGRITAAAVAGNLLLVTVIWLMVFKPGL